MITSTTKNKWLEKGYEEFANYGPDKISINKISKEIDSSRASFYHHFGDLDCFIDEILDCFWSNFEIFGNEGNEYCKVLIPDMYVFLANNNLILRFCRQLFLNRNSPNYGYVFSKVLHTASKGFMLKLFVDKCNLDIDDENAFQLWLTVSESWFSRIDSNNLSSDALIKITEDILESIDVLTNTTLYNHINK